MKVIGITQARFGSSRLPGKVLKKINNESLLGIHIDRAIQSKRIEKLVVATTHEPEAEEICAIAHAHGALCHKGSMDDVLDRFYQSVKNFHADYVVRITSDCPLIDGVLIDKVIDFTVERNLDYGSNVLRSEFPDGQDIEVFKFSVLEQTWKEAKLVSEREHVTPYISKNSSFNGGALFRSDNFGNVPSFGHIRMTVDEPNDFEVITELISHCGKDCSWLEYALYLERNDHIRSINSNFERNEGYKKSLKNDKL